MIRLRAGSLTTIVRVTLALVFGVAGFLKLFGGNEKETMFEALPAWGQYVLAILEVCLATWLSSGWAVRWAGAMTMLILAVFSVAIVREMGSEQPKDCGCLGQMRKSQDPSATRRRLALSLAMDGLMIAGAAFLALRRNSSLPARSRELKSSVHSR